MQEKKKVVIKSVVCILLLACVWGGYFFYMGQIKSSYRLKEHVFDCVFQIDSVRENKKELSLNGFLFGLEENASNVDYQVVLRELGSEKTILMKTEGQEREDVNNYFLCEYNYLESGFNAIIKKRKLDLKDKNYEICLAYNTDGRRAFQTGIYLIDGKLSYEKPEEAVTLDVEGTSLEEVVENGVLRVAKSEIGMYVYQYNGELYWIAEKEYPYFDTEGDTLVQLHLDTTQKDRLPQHRLENEWYWDNISFSFKSKEMVGVNTGKYRVAVVPLPTEYAISKVWTGYYDQEWIWREEFYPYYEFE